MQKVFVLDTNKKPLTPCRPKRARELLKQGKSAVFRMYPFTIILKVAKPNVEPRKLRFKVDPESKKSGIVIIDDESGEVIFAAEIEHRGEQIKNDLGIRRVIRRNRRNRNTRYRQPRFLNRTRAKGWLAPSLKSRVFNIETWLRRLLKISPITAVSQELVSFDMQRMQRSEVSKNEDQEARLHQYKGKEYLLEKWKRTCAYCGKKGTSLEVEHIVSKSKGGTDRDSNLTLACTPCNKKKGNRPIKEFLKDKPEVLKKIQPQIKESLKDASAVNVTCWALYEKLKNFGLPVELGSGYLTKRNRIQRNIPKEHWLDAAVVGTSTPKVLKWKGIKPLQIKSSGYGNRQVQNNDKYGFPRGKAKRLKIVHGFQTGDLVKAVVTDGQKIGTYFGRVLVRSSGYFDIKVNSKRVQGINWRFCVKIQNMDGYQYGY
ncbi:MAG: 5-methylcytosine-specific restriction endonuclease McrA [bacterium]|jgi:5-methylcytosine-specific restriction endonuclease McrA